MPKKIFIFVSLFVGFVILYFLINSKVETREPIIITSYGSYQEMSLDDLIVDSNLIVIGQLISVRPSHWNTVDGKLPKEITIDTITPDKVILTDFNFKIDQTIKGDFNQKVVLIRTLGGVVGNDQMIYNSVLKEIKTENYYLLFLFQDKRPLDHFDEAHYWVNGGYQGLYEIIDGRAISKVDKWDIDELIAYIQKSLSAESPSPVLSPVPTEFLIETLTPLPTASPTELLTEIPTQTPTLTETASPTP